MYRLLIADDEENIRNGIARSLPWQEWGYEVCAVCANGQEVLDQLDACRPDVVLSDIRMPGMDGMELMQRLNRDHPEIKIVILSGCSDFEYGQHGRRGRPRCSGRGQADGPDGLRTNFFPHRRRDRPVHRIGHVRVPVRVCSGAV